MDSPSSLTLLLILLFQRALEISFTRRETPSLINHHQILCIYFSKAVTRTHTHTLKYLFMFLPECWIMRFSFKEFKQRTQFIFTLCWEKSKLFLGSAHFLHIFALQKLYSLRRPVITDGCLSTLHATWLYCVGSWWILVHLFPPLVLPGVISLLVKVPSLWTREKLQLYKYSWRWVEAPRFIYPHSHALIIDHLAEN